MLSVDIWGVLIQGFICLIFSEAVLMGLVWIAIGAGIAMIDRMSSSIGILVAFGAAQIVWARLAYLEDAKYSFNIGGSDH